MLPTLINEIGPSNLSCRHAVRGTWEGQWKKRPAYPEVGGLKMWGDVPCNCSMCLEVIYAHWHVFEMCLCYLCLLSGNAKVAKAHKKYNKMGSNAPKALEGVTRSILSIFWADNLGLIFFDYFLAVQGQNMAILAGGLKMVGRCALQLFHVPWSNSWSFWCAFDVPLLPLLPLPFRWTRSVVKEGGGRDRGG